MQDVENATRLLALSYIKNYVGEHALEDILVNIDTMKHEIIVSKKKHLIWSKKHVDDVLNWKITNACNLIVVVFCITSTLFFPGKLERSCF